MKDYDKHPSDRNYLHYTSGDRKAPKIASNEIGKRLKKREAPNVNTNVTDSATTTASATIESTHTLISEEEITETSISSKSTTRDNFNQNNQEIGGNYLEKEVRGLRHTVNQWKKEVAIRLSILDSKVQILKNQV